MGEEDGHKFFELKEPVSIFVKYPHEILDVLSEGLEPELLHHFANLVDGEGPAAI